MNRRIAILLTNDDDSAFASQFPNDGQKVVQLLQPLRPEWDFHVLEVTKGVLPSDDLAFDAFVITGSPASVNDDTLTWLAPLLTFIRSSHAEKKPMIGLCFGHQAIAKALGGDVDRPGGWGLGTAETHWQVSPPWMQPVRPSTVLMAAHNEQVTRMPEIAVCIGGNSFCPTGSMLIGKHIWTTQYHPEMPLAFMQALLTHLQGQIDENTLGRAHASLSKPTDAPLFGQWMVQFFDSCFESRS